MRAFCTVSAPLEVCASSAEQLSPGSRFLALRLLGQQQPKTLYFLVDAKCRVKEVYTQTCVHFSGQGMLDTELFGLAVLIDGEYMFVDPESKLSKYGPKSWRSSHTHGLDANGRPLLELHFRVQFYIESPLMLKDETTRHNYYLQLKQNILQREIPRDCAEQALILLAGLALQADVGDAPTSASTTPTTTLSSSASSASSTNAASAAIAAATTIATTTATATETTLTIKQNAETATTTAIKTATTSATSTTATTTATKNVRTTVDNAATINKATTTTTTTTARTTTTTTLPKICKRWTSANERMLRLSTYVATTSQAAARGGNVFSRVPKIKPPRVPSETRRADNNSKASSNADYFRLEDYLPEALCTAWAASALRGCHRQNRGMSTANAELQFIRQACLIHETINAHIYRMRMSKAETGPGSTWFVVYPKGIKIINIETTSAVAVAAAAAVTARANAVSAASAVAITPEHTTFLWPNITKLSFDRKKFEIRSGDSKITLYAAMDEKNRMLLNLCREAHQFTMKFAARLKEIAELEEEENASLHVCYTSSRSLHLPYTKNKNDQRISVISSTSSNTTSGIISDRVHSEDELEIMINSPPVPIAAPSTESLALAHLLDRPSVSRQTSSVGKVSLKGLEEQLAALSVRQLPMKRTGAGSSGDESQAELCNTSAANSPTSSALLPTLSQPTTDSSTATDSPNSQHNIGSKCSSTCSTVVVTTQSKDDAASNQTDSIVSHRRNSTSSSLEIGFSHTAQNSTVSEAESSTFMQSGHEEIESVSGVYTLAHVAPPTETSGVYTMNSSELTGQSSEIAESVKSSQYGTLDRTTKSEISDDHLLHDDDHDHHLNIDSVDGKEYGRMRSDSNISTSGSFRGDGSDPTDNKLTLLSAEELTELIVGRGAYSKRQKASGKLRTTVESYIKTRDVVATTENNVEDLINDLLPTDPPAPPAPPPPAKCNESNSSSSLTSIKMRAPPPYTAHHATTGLCGPPIPTKLKIEKKKTSTNVPCKTKKVSKKIKSTEAKPAAAVKAAAAATTTPLPTTNNNSTNAMPPVRRRDPPPYSNSAKARPTSLISLSSHTAAATATATLNNCNTTNRLISQATNTSMAMAMVPKTEEITARFIKSRPQINILKAHTSVVNECAQPSYAAPTNRVPPATATAIAGTGTGAAALAASGFHFSHQRYSSNTQRTQHVHHQQSSAAQATAQANLSTAGSAVIPNAIGIPVVPYKLHSAHKSMPAVHQHHSHLAQPTQPPPPYPEVKPQKCMLLPVIKPSQFLTPPPSSLPRQPPPPPPPTGVFSSHLAPRPTLELYQQQLYSDVDYVIYPIQDTGVSQQDYYDAKQSSMLCQAMTHATPAPTYLLGGWDTCKGHTIYRSTPYLPIALSPHAQYASTQNLSDTYLQLPGTYSPLYSPASLCSAYEPPPPRPLHATAALVANAASSTPSHFARSRSDDNILNSLDSLPKVRRMPPPPLPPPYVNRNLKKERLPDPTDEPPPIPSKPSGYSSSNNKSNTISNSAVNNTSRQLLPPRRPITLHPNRAGSPMTKTSSGAQWAGERPRPDGILGSRLGGDSSSNSILAQLQLSMANNNRQATANDLDIALLREKSKHLDLPLIAALCNDRSLLKQTKVSAAAPAQPAQPDGAVTAPAATIALQSTSDSAATVTVSCTTTPPSQRSSSEKSTNSKHMLSISSGVSKTMRKSSTIVSHRHPSDKLPPLPMPPLVEANTYVIDPAIQKHHKSHNNI